MAGKDEISSTEKLLDLIRDENNQVQEPSNLSAEAPDGPEAQTSAEAPAAPEVEPVAETSTAPLLSNVIPMRKKTTVGVDIGYHELKLAMINQISERKHELLDFATSRRCSTLP